MEKSQNATTSDVKRYQLGTRIPAATKALLDEACKERNVSVSDLVNEALLRHLTPGTVDQDMIFEQVLEMQKTLQVIVEYLARQEEQKQETPRIATHAELYPDMPAPVPEPESSPPPPRLRGWRRWFLVEVRQ